MFVYAIIFAVIIGFVLKGNLKNLGEAEIKGIYLAIIGFGIDALIHVLALRGSLKIGTATYVVDLAMYVILFVFTYLNRKNVFMLLIGFGFLLNAFAIFSNGGAMPVSHSAMVQVKMVGDGSTEGLYKLVNSHTNLWFLCDIIPVKLFINVVVSIGDLFSAAGIMLFIITSMKIKKALRA